MEAPALRVAGEDRCVTVITAPDACIVVSPRFDVRVAAVAPIPPEPLPAPSGAEGAAGMFRSVPEAQPAIGFSPAFPVPVHILLRRYLS